MHFLIFEDRRLSKVRRLLPFQLLTNILTRSMVGRSLPPDAATATPRTSRPTNAYSNSDIIDYFFDCSRSAGTCAARPRACFISFALITSAAWVPATMPLPAATCRCEDLLATAASALAALVLQDCRSAAVGAARCPAQVPFPMCCTPAALYCTGCPWPTVQSWSATRGHIQRCCAAAGADAALPPSSRRCSCFAVLAAG